jgi:anti-sigma regulatory factor (Ser/Thr protein kinase)
LARGVLEERLGARLGRRALDDARTVVSELVNNAFVHGVGTIGLVVRLSGKLLRIEVTDEGQRAAIAVTPSGTERGGHGMRIVDGLCTAWGAVDGRTRVWAEIEVGTA